MELLQTIHADKSPRLLFSSRSKGGVFMPFRVRFYQIEYEIGELVLRGTLYFKNEVAGLSEQQEFGVSTRFAATDDSNEIESQLVEQAAAWATRKANEAAFGFDRKEEIVQCTSSLPEWSNEILIKSLK